MVLEAILIYLWTNVRYCVIIQLNLSNTDTEGTEQSARIREVSVL